MVEEMAIQRKKGKLYSPEGKELIRKPWTTWGLGRLLKRSEEAQHFASTLATMLENHAESILDGVKPSSKHLHTYAPHVKRAFHAVCEFVAPEKLEGATRQQHMTFISETIKQLRRASETHNEIIIALQQYGEERRAEAVRKTLERQARRLKRIAK